MAAEEKVFYNKMKGDYNKYISEYATDDARSNAVDKADKAYREATTIATE